MIATASAQPFQPPRSGGGRSAPVLGPNEPQSATRPVPDFEGIAGQSLEEIKGIEFEALALDDSSAAD